MKMEKSLIDEYIRTMDNIIYSEYQEDDIIKHYLVKPNIGQGKIKRFKINDSINIIRDMTVRKWLEFGLDGFTNILEISYCFKGRSEIFLEPKSERYIIKEGDLILHHNRNGRNMFRFRYENLESLSIHIDLGSIVELGYNFNLERMSLDEIMDDKNLMIINANDKIKSMANDLKNLQVNDINDYLRSKLKVTNFFLEALDFLVVDKKLNEKEKENLDKILAYLNTRVFEELKIEEILAMYDLTEYKLQKLFKTRFNTTFYQYLKRVRIEKSLKFLVGTDMKIIDISQLIGYSNPSKYTEAFKSIMKLTPKEYRQVESDH